MTNIKELIKIFALALVICAVLLCAVFFFLKPGKETAAGKERVSVYFLDPVNNKLIPEIYLLDKAGNEEMADAVLNILHMGPRAKNLVKTIPDNLRLIEGGLAVYPDSPGEYTLELNFSEDYYGMSPADELFMRGSLVWSMTELDFINDVAIFVEEAELPRTDGQPMGYLSRSNVLLDPAISPDKVDTQRVKLYFYDADAHMLAPEERVIQVNPDYPIERYVMEQIILGPKTAGLSPVLPSETRLKSEVKTEEGICYVNLSGEFASKNTADGERLRLNIYAVVNALTELSSVKKVQFLIESEKMEDFKGAADLSMPIERDESVIVQ